MAKKTIAHLREAEISDLGLIVNKIACAKQAVSPAALPEGAPPAETKLFFRDAIFTLAEYRFLQRVFWLDLAARFKVDGADLSRLTVDFNTEELFLAGEEAEQ
jgi:hypothetical protein